MSKLSGWARGRLFEIDGGNGETCVVCAYEYEPKYRTWRCIVVRGSKMYPVGGYNIIVSQDKFSDENECVAVSPTVVRYGSASDERPVVLRSVSGQDPEEVEITTLGEEP